MMSKRPNVHNYTTNDREWEGTLTGHLNAFSLFLPVPGGTSVTLPLALVPLFAGLLPPAPILLLPFPAADAEEVEMASVAAALSDAMASCTSTSFIPRGRTLRAGERLCLLILLLLLLLLLRFEGER